MHQRVIIRALRRYVQQLPIIDIVINKERGNKEIQRRAITNQQPNELQ